MFSRSEAGTKWAQVGIHDPGAPPVPRPHKLKSAPLPLTR
jgi:hypothetical protein